ncbi:hypothetical protein [Saccharopolyspora griseoalba]|uniref:Aminoglycoside phosphotransferase domain-containing protein n=1 Tax=Saccharopolyspora griseoalba TaxID=1431848 RepID=A0ABW2LRR7_9PSEU
MATRRWSLIGSGVHSEVWHRTGSAYCLQLFRPDAPELTPTKIDREYAYLQHAYRAMPRLLPHQRLLRLGGTLTECVLVKQYVSHSAVPRLHRVDPDRVPAGALAQLRQFLAVTRRLLAAAPDVGEAVLLPDIIDDECANLVIDNTGALRLVDTNRLISGRKLAELRGAPLPLDTHVIHAKFLRRMLLFESTFLGRRRSELARDPLYTQFLDPPTFAALLEHSAALGEPI